MRSGQLLAVASLSVMNYKNGDPIWVSTGSGRKKKTKQGWIVGVVRPGLYLVQMA